MDALANVVVVVHLAYFVFVVWGFVNILIGAFRHWPWIYNPWFRMIHLLAVLLIPAEDVFHFSCLLNTAENVLRPTPVEQVPSSGVGYALNQLLHHTIPGRVLDGMYWTLGVVLLVLMFAVPPHFRRASTTRSLRATR